MISITISALIFTAVAYLGFYNARSLAALTNYVDLDRNSRHALDILSRDIRQADKLASFTTSELIFNTGGGTNNLRFLYSTNGEFVRIEGTTREVLLDKCDEMVMTVYGRNTISNNFGQFPTTNAANAKLLKFNWTCSRTILGARVNTESVQSAKIVIRKQN